MRSLQRFRLRLQVTWRTPGGALAPVTARGDAALGAWLASQPGGLGGGARRRRRAGRGRGARGGGDASRGGPRPARRLPARRPRTPTAASARRAAAPRAQLFSGWAALGLASAGYDPATVSTSGGRTLGRLPGADRRLRNRPGLAGAERSSRCARPVDGVVDVGGRDLLAELRHDICPQRLGLPADELDGVRRAGAAGRRRAAADERRSPGSRASRTPTAASTSRPRRVPATSMTPAPRSRRSLAPAAHAASRVGRAVAFIRAPAEPRRRLPDRCRGPRTPNRRPSRCRG